MAKIDTNSQEDHTIVDPDQNLYIKCEDCNGSGLTLDPYCGEPTFCRTCRGDTVVKASMGRDTSITS